MGFKPLLHDILAALLLESFFLPAKFHQ